MVQEPARRLPSVHWSVLVIIGVVSCLALGYGMIVADRQAESGPGSAPPPKPKPLPVASHKQVDAFCADCHKPPPPETFPRSAWRREVQRGYDFHRQSGIDREAPDLGAVVRYYQRQAPGALPQLEPTPTDRALPILLKRQAVPGPNPDWKPSISFIDFVELAEPGRPEWLVCDMGLGRIWSCRFADDLTPQWRALSERIPHPARAEVTDLNQDGQRDLLVADLGMPLPSDERLGQVVWLKAQDNGQFEHRVLLTNVGRVADVRPIDGDGDGDLDLVVAVFGWHRVGGILYLENQGLNEDGTPSFAEPQELDDRPGTIHVPVTDLNGDDRPDFVALISQHYETVVAFLNQGDGQFEPQTLFEADHPAFGASGLQLVDLNVDGDLDVLLSNGDVYDSPLIKPYHGVSWLENTGQLQFEHHELGPLYGAHRASATDLTGNGLPDVVASGFLAEPVYGQQRKQLEVDAVVLFEQTSPGQFRRHLVESVTSDYPTFAFGDVDGNGRPDLVLGRFLNFEAILEGRPFAKAESPTDALVVWKNLGPNTEADELVTEQSD